MLLAVAFCRGSTNDVQAEARLEEERDHVPLYLLGEIMHPLMKTCNIALIADHMKILREEFQVLLENDRIEDLGRMYKLLLRVPEGLDPLRSRFEKHVVTAGKIAVAKVANAGGENLEPKAYVDALLAVHTQYSDLVNSAFDGESEFVRSLDSACREFVNHNQVCEKATNRSPELLAKYTDTLLKRTAKTAEDDDLETLLTQIVSYSSSCTGMSNPYLDDYFQVHRRQRCFPEILFSNAGKASCPNHIRFR